MALGAAPETQPSDSTAGWIASHWVQLKEGQADGTIEMNARHPANPDPHLLMLHVTHYAGPGQGRFGAQNTTPISVKKGAYYDVTFKGISDGIGVGLVFSLETSDGKVLARTTLPEVGRGAMRSRRGRGAANAPAPWQSYFVTLHARAAGQGHLVITPIETVPVWLEHIRLVERKTKP
jgi:hypothetical protein